jgi:hypothetical protein
MEVTMVSKAIAALDQWLIRAEEVLQEQRVQSISPNLDWKQTVDEWTVTMADFEVGLPDLLETICSRPGRWILIAEADERRNWFWQALAFEDGSLVTEVVSNRYLEGDDRLTPWDEVRLAELGWDAPEQPSRPNWLVVSPTTSPDIEIEACRAVATLRTIFRLADDNPILVRMFSSPNRGDTPATAGYEERPSDGDSPALGGTTRWNEFLTPQDLPPIGTRVEVAAVSGKPPPECRYGIGTVVGHERFDDGWRVDVTYDQPTGGWCGSPCLGTLTFPRLVHVIGGPGRAFSTMTPSEIEAFVEAGIRR